MGTADGRSAALAPGVDHRHAPPLRAGRLRPELAVLVRFLPHPSAAPLDLEVDVHDPRATVADLIHALLAVQPIGTRADALAAGSVAVLVDGRPIHLDRRIDACGLGDGGIVALTEAVVDGSAAVHHATGLDVVGGLDVGRRLRLGRGRHEVRAMTSALDGGGTRAGAEVDDPTMRSRRIAAVLAAAGPLTARPIGVGPVVTIDGRPIAPPEPPRSRRDHRSIRRWWVRLRTSPTRSPLPGWGEVARDRSAPTPDQEGGTTVPIGSVLGCGAARLEVVLTEDDPPPEPPARGAATRPLHRTPRPDRPPPEPDLVPPPAPEAPPAVTPIGIVALVGSMAMGAVLVVLLHSWTYAVFALLGPVLMVANAIDARTRRRRVGRRGARRHRQDLATFEEAVADRAAHACAQRAVDLPGALALIRRTRASPSTGWERRRGQPGAHLVRIGTGSVPWAPPVAGAPESWPSDVADLVARHRRLDHTAVGCRLEPGTPIAVVGPSFATAALARSVLVQAVALHGPADVRVAVLTDTEGAGGWDWTAWLPHARGADGASLLAAHPDAAARVVGALLASPPTGASSATRPPAPPTIVVIDDLPGLAAGRSPARSLLRAARDPARGVVPLVLVRRSSEVPAACTVELTVDEQGTLQGPSDLLAGPAVVEGVGREVAADVARRLARLDDPEVDAIGAGLPDDRSLGPLLGTGADDPFGLEAITDRWRVPTVDPPPAAVLGQAADGTFAVDLAIDGPHVLVAGTTGAGKSELLRTLVASLALGQRPDQLTFVLIDFKGGSAFDACARLPHTTGLVTDLDAHLATRALRCLEAELRHREQVLRAAGADDLAAYRCARTEGDPLPRLVVVIDEFATLAAELPDFVDALVGIAQRGRSLGVHLVLATQRPSGSVSDHIRANTNLRIALRVQDPADSRDVIDRPDAADLPRRTPGRALARLGPGELVAFQAARVTGPAAVDRPPVTAAPLRIERDPTGPSPADTAPPSANAGGAATDLDRLVDAASRAWQVLGGVPPRPPWPDPLPDDLPFAPLAGPDRSVGTEIGPDELVVGTADDPDHQRHRPFAWDLAAGPLLAVGLTGSGTTTLAATAVLAAAHRWSPAQCHVHVVDLGSGGLAPLTELAHVGAVVPGDDHERQRRLVAELSREVARRRAAGPGGPARPRRILVVDGLAAFRSIWDDVEPTGTWDRLVDLIAHGTEVGVHVLATATGGAIVPHAVLGACRQRLVFRLADRGDHAAFGSDPANVPIPAPGRCTAPHLGLVVQVAHPTEEDVQAAIASSRRGLDRAGGSADLPARVAVLPDDLRLVDLPSPWGAYDADRSIRLTLGLADADLSVTQLDLPAGAHALVAGPPRSGRTTALASIATAAQAAGALVIRIGHTPPDGLDRRGAAIHRLDIDRPDLLDAIEALERSDDDDDRPTLVLVDDADLTPDDHPGLARLVSHRDPRRHVVAAGRSDRLRSAYGHWTRELQADRTGLLLQPDPDLDGDLLGARLPRRFAVHLPPGRAWLADRRTSGLIQVARAEP